MTALQKKEKLMFNNLLSDLKIPHYSIYVGKVLKRNILSNKIIYYTKLCTNSFEILHKSVFVLLFAHNNYKLKE